MKKMILMGLLLLLLGCGFDDPTGLDTPRILQPSELCSDYPDDAIPTFEDAAFGEATLEAVNRTEEIDFFWVPVRLTPEHEHLTCGLISGLNVLVTDFLHIGSLVGGQNLTGLSYLSLLGNSITEIGPLSGLTGLNSLTLGDNSITDLSPLSGLTRLRNLDLGDNSITDISPLGGLTGLPTLSLDNNSITDLAALSGIASLKTLYLAGNRDLSDIQPLLDNTGFGAGDWVDFRDTNVSCADVAALEAKGVEVDSDCP